MKTLYAMRTALMLLTLPLFFMANELHGQPPNELNLMGHLHGSSVYLVESGNDYYYAYHFDGSQPVHSPVYSPGVMLKAYKSHKMNYSLQHAATWAGDTTQADSIIVGNWRYARCNGNIAFASSIYYSASLNLGIILSVLDTALNTVIAQRRLKSIPVTGTWQSRVLGLSPLGTRLAIFYSRMDTTNKTQTCAMLVDADGQILKDTLVVDYEYEGIVTISVPGEKCMLSDGYRRILLDSNLAVLDTFQQNAIMYNGWFINTGDEIALPSGTLICGTEYSAYPGYLGDRATALSRRTPASRYAYDTTVLFMTTSLERTGGGQSLQNLQYNAYDNRIYYANATRQNFGGSGCENSGNDVQVICTDTLLRTIWRKFISFDLNVCASVSWVAASDGRGGVGVMGYQYDTRYSYNDSIHSGSFLFHLDSIGNVSVANGPKPSVRDRLKIYPNPATDAVVIDDILGGLSGFAIYDMSGRSVSSGKATGKLARASLEGLPTGPYILRVLLSDWSAVSETVLKR